MHKNTKFLTVNAMILIKSDLSLTQKPASQAEAGLLNKSNRVWLSCNVMCHNNALVTLCCII